MDVKALIIYGDGINAHQELKTAFSENGAIANLVPINILIENPKMIHDYDIIGFPGGFSFGDEIRSGKVFAIKTMLNLKSELMEFVKNDKLIIGICNGFQILMQLNLFSDREISREMTLGINDHHQFRNFWTTVKVNQNNPSVWLKDLNHSLKLPVRHKEGRIIGDLNDAEIAFWYEEAINGSKDNIAGLTNKKGNVLGLMPHPEAALSDLLNPEFVEANNAKFVNKLFINGIRSIKLLKESKYACTH